MNRQPRDVPAEPRARAVRGNPARSDALARFIDYAKGFKDVVFMRRIDIARSFAQQVPKP